ncbi:inhibitor of apoptosis-promoting Bax1-domain-containing protein [Cladochytrium replicatum]|nr:inhibitor of apoptosis-promoting Bax1-domain-containing protein [Cladochytrium replicatum]
MSKVAQPRLSADDDGVGTTYAPGYDAIPTTSQPPAYQIPRDFADEDDFDKFATNVAESERNVRMNFVRKVYAILAGQLALTSIVASIMMYSPPVKEWAQANTWSLILSFVGVIGTLIPLIIYRRTHPLNLYLLTLFTVFEAYGIGMTVSFYDSIVVLQAVLLTFSLFIGLTFFTVQSKWDFDYMAPFLSGAVWALFSAIIISWFLPFSSALYMGLSYFIAVLFCGYIVYDTHMIFNRLSPEEYIIGAIELYLDILNLFLSLLRILNNRN